MTVNRAILCGFIAAMASGGLQAADGVQKNGFGNNFAVSANMAEDGDSIDGLMIGEGGPEPTASTELKGILAGCVKNRKPGQSLSDCIAYWDDL